MPDTRTEIIERLEAAILEATAKPPVGEYGYCLVRIADLRMVLHELEVRDARD